MGAGFPSLDALEAYRHGASTMARAEDAGWEASTGGMVRRAAELFYVVRPLTDREEPDG